MKNKGNVVLCGFMGSGKTTLGSLLARRMGLEFRDLDDYIVRVAGMPVAAIFQQFGEEGFREREHQAVLDQCTGGQEGCVLATGGGALTFARNVEPLRSSGLILYLNPGFEECWRRISASDRPLVRSNSREQLEELYRRRDELYKKAAHWEVSMEGPPSLWVDAMERLAREALGMEA